ncbi:hypothetical protein MXF31_10905 [Mammaliicoccus sciuri]|uniref:hypothetical protein n=2 Tax=Mammaliicoccus sciuri TaxID=1296 RepID=UPI002DBEFE84|nr:hypothetical protein [Mammaliicoccus sciuri]MEB5650150.1 hypothetical protein [Mammaliicoccus sciuri]
MNRMRKDLSIVDSKLRVMIIHSVDDMKLETEKALYDLTMNDYDIKEVIEDNNRTIIKYYIDDELYQLERM